LCWGLTACCIKNKVKGLKVCQTDLASFPFPFQGSVVMKSLFKSRDRTLGACGFEETIFHKNVTFETFVSFEVIFEEIEKNC
jgi:hypothetical protein